MELELIKEAAEMYSENISTKFYKDIDKGGWMHLSFIEGAKWHKTKSHTNTEVIKILYEQMEAMDFYGKDFEFNKFWEKYKK